MVNVAPSLPLMLGRYALYEKIASGGMASVHIGRLVGPEAFARTVAVKRMHPQFASDPEFVSMFLDEARLAARIHHPNVVPTLEVVATAGELFLVMELVQGESLSHLIRGLAAQGRRIPQDIAVGIMVGVLDGLHAAHEAKSERGEPLEIVHRDVSPQNVLVGIDGVARILDFGVAKAVGRLHQTTQEGQLKGKLSYMSPEQINGTVSRVTDVYAASVVLWEALTGKSLFKGENDGQTLNLVLKGCDTPPSARVPSIAPALDAIVMRGLRLEATQRFLTARDMARALEAVTTAATPSRIGDWVEATAKESLAKRNGIIAGIESDRSLVAPASPSVVSTVVLRPTGVRRRSNAWLVAAGGGLTLLAVVAFASHRSAKSVASVARVEATSGLTSAAPAPPTSGGERRDPDEVVTSSQPAAAVSPDPSTTTHARAQSASKAPATGSRKPPPTATPTAPPVAQPTGASGKSAAPTCSVATRYDAEGQPHFEKVCK